KHLGAYSRLVDPPRLQAFRQVGEKTRWSAEIEIGVLWNAHLLEKRHGKMTVDVIVDPGPIIVAWPAVDVAEMAPRQRRHQGAHLPCESMVCLVARRVEPPDLARQAIATGRRVQHGEQRRDTDPGAQQDNGRRARSKRE